MTHKEKMITQEKGLKQGEELLAKTKTIIIEGKKVLGGK